MDKYEVARHARQKARIKALATQVRAEMAEARDNHLIAEARQETDGPRYRSAATTLRRRNADLISILNGVSQNLEYWIEKDAGD